MTRARQSVTSASTADAMQHALESMRDSIHREGAPDLAVRRDRLQRLSQMLSDNRRQICKALNGDYGFRSSNQSDFAEIVTSLRAIRAARRGVRRWMRTEKRRVGLLFSMVGTRARIEYLPLGVVGIISPWNFPVNLTVVPLAGVLAAGNRALIKPSEQTPRTSALLEELLRQYFAPEEVMVFNGDAEVGMSFASLPLDHLVFTGAGSVARHIMAAAAGNLTPTTLELGGKSPAVIGPGADLQRAARSLMYGKVFNAGQVCLAPDTVYVPATLQAKLISCLRSASEEMLGGVNAPKDYVSIVNSRHANRLRRYIEDARALGAGIITLGPKSRDQENTLPVTLVISPSPECAISREEIFGPLLVIRTYEEISEAVDAINAGDTPLALYYFGRRGKEQKRLLAATRSGGVTINDVIMHYTVDDLPFGGLGASGMGAYHGIEGFRQFSHARSIYTASPLDISAPLRPPFGPAFRAVSSWLEHYG